MLLVFVFMLLGSLFFLLDRMNKAKVKPDYNFIIFLDKNWIPTALNIIGGSVIIFGLGIEKGAFMYGGFDFTLVFAGVLGVAGQVIFKGVIDLLKTDVATKIGFNKK
jgi:hypothetical protein